MDAKLTSALKHTFERARPSDDIYHNFSFPSGHSTSIYFTLGFFLLVVVPCLNSVLSRERQLSGRSEPNAVEAAVATVSKPTVGLGLTVAGASVTQTGRLVADVHWFSDVVGGAMLGAWGVVLSIMLLQALDSKLGLADDA